MTENYQNLLALMIITNSNFANAYDLCKVLSWQFKIINCSEIINKIEAEEYVVTTYPKSKTLKFFELTLSGKKKLEEEINLVIKTLKEEFPDKIDFIEALSSFK